MTTLAEFILQRIAEDEAAAHYATTRDRVSDADWGGWWLGHYQHYSRYDPTRVLADCAAKRLTVEAVRGWFADQGGDDPAGILRTLALSFADHPDYDPEWRP